MKYLLFPLLITCEFCYGQGCDVTPISAAGAIAARGRSAAFTLFGKLEIYTYGLADFGSERSRARVARRWGFSYRSIAGCVVTHELVDSAKQHNSAVEAAIARTHGTDWKTRFEKEVAEAIALDNIIEKAALQNPIIVAAQKKLNDESKGLLFEPGKPRADGRLEVYAYAYDDWESRPAFVTLYTLSVDTALGRADVVNNNRWLFRALD